MIGAVNSPMHTCDAKKFVELVAVISDVVDIVEAIVYLTEARRVTGEVPHVGSGAHNAKW